MARYEQLHRSATVCGPHCPTGPHAHPVTLDDELEALTTPQPRKAPTMKLTTPDMDPCKIEPHDLRRDVETYRDTFPTYWERATDAAQETRTKLQRIVLEAVACGNRYGAALATLVLNIDAPGEDEPA